MTDDDKKRVEEIGALHGGYHDITSQSPNCQTCLLISQVQALREENERLRRLHSTFHSLNDSFEYGEQPCKDFRPQRDGNDFGEWDNRHECPGCCGLRSFCVGCSTDHHGNGWENCASRAKARLREAESQLSTQSAQVVSLKQMLELILPLAKGYAAINPVGSNQEYVAEAEQAFADKDSLE